ncbi:MAG: TIGR02452 family protein [Acidobacteriota bacterium]|nr:TIGR02452 family protein [Acidobacteriota bacterium]
MRNLNRKEIARETLDIIEKGFYQNAAGEIVSIENETRLAVENSKLFRPEDFPETSDLAKIRTGGGETKFEVTDETTLEAAKRICREDARANPFVLNFASAKNPGGGFLGGAQAQEESLARSSALYPALTANFEMYEFNRRGNSCLYSDYMIYSPSVPVFRNDDGSLIDKPYLVSFLTSPAVNAGVVKQREPEKIDLIESVNRRRARKFLWIAAENRHRILILGAWGCGVFQNEPQMIAGIFAGLLKGEFAGCFEHVIFAVYDTSRARRIYQAFAASFA